MDAITAYARNLLDLHGFQNWTIVVEPSTFFAGKTIYAHQTIVLNALLPTVSEDRWRDVVVHEVAHVRAGQFCSAHGQRWHALALAMGGTGSVKV